MGAQQDALLVDFQLASGNDAGAHDADGTPSETQDTLSRLARAQLIIDKCNLLIAKQALRIDELERVLRKFVK